MSAVPPSLDIDSKSGSRLWREVDERGRALVFKHEVPAEDWLLLSLGDSGRLPRLWDAGIFGRLPASVDAAIERVERTPDGWTVVMRDVGASLFPDSARVSRAQSRQILSAAADMHAAFRDVVVPDGLCSLRDRYTFLSPDRAGELSVRHAVPRVAMTGWERFPDVVPDDVAAVVLGLVAEPQPLLDALGRRPATLIHGDLKLGNLGIAGDQVVVLDWGCWAGTAPPATAFAWYISLNAGRIDASHDEILDDVRAAEGDAHDEDALRLALLGNLVQNGWDKALSATNDHAVVRAREQADVDWWVQQTRATLEVWTPG